MWVWQDDSRRVFWFYGLKNKSDQGGFFYSAFKVSNRAMAFTFPDIDPVALAIGPVVIRWYALAYLAGFLLGWKYCLGLVSSDVEKRPNKTDIDDFLTWAVVGVILGGRLGYVLFYQPAHYMANPSEILMVWKGGMSFHGGVIGVSLSILLFALRRRISVLALSDLICATAPIGLFFGRIANFINGELYGRITTVSWAVVFPSDNYARHPSQLYEAGLEGIVLFFLIRYLIRKKDILAHRGAVTGIFLIGYGVFRAFVELFREPDAHIGLIGEFISMGQILCLPMIFAGIAVLFYARRTEKAKNV